MNVGKVKIIIALLILLGVSACSPIIKIEQPQRTDWIELSSRQNIGQTFTARYDGLEGIEVFIKPNNTEQGNLTLHVKNNPDDANDLMTSQIPITNFTKPKLYPLNFSPQNDSVNQSYYLLLEVDGNSSLSIRTAPGETYQNGALYASNDPIDSQLSFNLIYNTNLAVIGLFHEIFTWMKYFLIGIFLFIIPGWAIFSLLYHQWSQKCWMEKIGLAAGVSLAIYPILILWTNLVGLRLGALYAWLPPILGFLVIIWQNRIWMLKPTFPDIKKITIADITYILISGFIFFVRFWAIRNLPAPMWGDGYQHTVISQLIVDNHGLFNSWQPYAEITSFSYHYGFHSLVAAYHWISELFLPQATLWTGQILNGLSVLCLVPLVMKISRNRWSGIIAITLAGLVFHMPMYYLNWGRYTQLAGQIVLISCIYLAWESLDKQDNNWRIFLLNCLVMTGLALTHYRVLFFAVCYYLVAIIFNKKINYKTIIVNSIITGIFSIILFSPWIINIINGKLPEIQSAILSIPVKTNTITSSNLIGDPFFYLPKSIWLFLIFIVGWGLYSRNKEILQIIVWWIFILFLANPQWLGLPGSGIITNFAVFIAVYIPAGITIGGVVGEFIDKLIKHINKHTNQNLLYFNLINLSLCIILVLVGNSYSRSTINLINPDNFALVTQPDMKAMKWIKKHIAADSKFLVNSFLAYDNTISVGCDAGWWLPYLSHQKSILPPINYGTETNQIQDFNQIIFDLTSTIQNNGVISTEAMQKLLYNNITHIYIGQKQGRVNNPGLVINPNDLSKDSRFKEIYHIDRVWIFELVY